MKTFEKNLIQNPNAVPSHRKLNRILNIQKISDFLSLKFPMKLGGNSR